MGRTALAIFAMSIAGALACGGRESAGGISSGGEAATGVDSDSGGGISCPTNCALLGAVCDATTGLCVGTRVAAPTPGASTPETPECRWPPALDIGGPGACGVARALVTCTDPPYLGLSDGGGDLCQNLCAPNQYAVFCGAFGPPAANALANQSAPAGCVDVQETTSGWAYFCCPCQKP